jgi:serine/threonine-protein kinase RsbW
MRDERHISFKARLENVPSACEFVVQAAQAANLDERGIYHSQLAVDEACTNIIEHGFPTESDRQRGQIQVMTGLEDDNTFVIMIEDNSPAFNPLTYREPDPARPIEEREAGGWGIYFIKKLMDMVDYRFVDGRNLLTLRKYIDQSHARPDQAIKDGISVTRTYLDKDYVQVNLGGQIDSHTSAQFEAALSEDLSQRGHYRLVLSFADVTYISSSGLKVLVSAWRKARERGGDVLIADLQPRIREVFEMIGFDMMFRIYDTPADAVADDPIGR